MRSAKQAISNQELVSARLRQGWSQQELADRVGTTPVNVSRWERGATSPGPYFRQRLCVIFDTSEQKLGLATPPVDTKATALEELSSPEAPIQQPATIALTQTEAVEEPAPPITGRLELTTRRLELTQATALEELSALEAPIQEPAAIALTQTDAVEEPTPPITGRLEGTNENRLRMIQRLTRWSGGFLAYSIYNETLLILGLQEQPDAVANPWRLTVQESESPARLLPPGVRITQVFDDSDHALLILGEPGAGKTTLLLELMRDLLERATLDDRHPIPVLFNLSSWAQKKLPLVEWLVEELNTKYQVPRKLGQAWVAAEAILPLLDGLDEVASAARSACVKAINTYRQEHGMAQMAVCSRSADYFDQTARVLLQTAVVVQPLTPEQIEDYLASAGESLSAVKVVLQHDSALRELVKSPLMLNILAVTYSGMSASEITAGEPKLGRQMLFEKYIERALQWRGTNRYYTPEQMKRWLAWLAQQLAQRDQTEFYLERLQPDWLSGQRERSRYRDRAVRLIYAVQVVITLALDAWLPGVTGGDIKAGLLGLLGGDNSLFGWMTPGPGGSFDGAGMFRLLFGLLTTLTFLQIAASPNATPQRFWKAASRGLLIGIVATILIAIFSFLLFFTGSQNISYALNEGLVVGISSGLVIGLVGAFILGSQTGSEQARTPKTRRTSYTRIADGLVLGLCGGVSFALVVSATINLQEGLFYGAMAGLAVCILFGPAGGTALIRNLGTEIQPAEIVSWDTANMFRDLPRNIGNGLLVGLTVMTTVTLVIGVAASLFHSLFYAWRYGLVCGLVTGLVAGVASILTRVLNSWWASSNLDAHLLVKPNEGMRRSLSNGLLAGCLFGPIGGIASGLACGLAFGLLGGLSGAYILGIGLALVSGVILGMQFATLRGLNAYIEHYLLRWSLWRSGKTPLNYVRFLDYATERILLRKVGNGYIFAHRLLLEHFASLGDHATIE